jgi:hypothetical protein
MKNPIDRGDRAGVIHVQPEQAKLEAIHTLHGVAATHENSALVP